MDAAQNNYLNNDDIEKYLKDDVYMMATCN